jgi:hypothetical protein
VEHVRRPEAPGPRPPTGLDAVGDDDGPEGPGSGPRPAGGRRGRLVDREGPLARS